MNAQPMTIEQAVALHQTGEWDRAAVAYDNILAAEPHNANALHLSGVIALQRGDYTEAVRRIEQALSVSPQQAAFHNNLGTAYQGLEQWEQAEAHFRAALAVNAEFVDAHYNLARLCYQQGKLDEALAEFAIVLQHQPLMAQAHHHMALVLRRLGRFDDAIASLMQAISIEPSSTEFAFALAVTYARAGQTDTAIAAFRRLCWQSPEHTEARLELAGLLINLGRWEEAVSQLHEIVERDPNHARGWHFLATIHLRRLELSQAERCARHALHLKPGFAAAHNTLGSLLREKGQLTEAIAAFEEAICLSPQAAEPYANLAAVQQIQGRPQEAVATYRRALELESGSPRIHSNLLMALHYDDTQTPEEILAEHQRWYQQHVRPTIAPPPRVVDCGQSRKLRIGYLSGDFRAHSVANFIEPILRNHDRSKFYVTCYSDVTVPDAVTARLKERADLWRNVHSGTDADVRQMIIEDEIDILIDLAGHTGGNRLQVLASRAAPVQMTHLGYGGTTGLPEVDYRLTDPVTDPLGESPRHSEQLLRLPTGVLCYAQPPQCPPVAPLPYLSSGMITFGSFNNMSKINRSVIELWAKILNDIPASRLLLKNVSLTDPTTAETVREMFRSLGIASERLDLRGHVDSQREHLGLYGQVDITLDTFPYTGATTTCESLWMGVPVVTLRGDTYVGRLSASLLTQLGRPDWIAESAQAYRSIAVTLARDPDQLAGIRRELRERMSDSPICDATVATRELERLYRESWNHYCRGSRQAG